MNRNRNGHDHGDRVACPVVECECKTGVVEWDAGEQLFVHVGLADLDESDADLVDDQL